MSARTLSCSFWPALGVNSCPVGGVPRHERPHVELLFLASARVGEVRSENREHRWERACSVHGGGCQGRAQCLHAGRPGALLLRGAGARAGGGAWQGSAVRHEERDSAFTALVYRFWAALRTCGIILSAILAMSGRCEERLRQDPELWGAARDVWPS